MKQLIRIVIVAMLVVANGAAAMAQGNKGQRISREELAQKQALYISGQLALEGPAAERFVATYCDYQKRVWALGPRIKKKNHASEAEVEGQMQARFERSKKILELREEFYEKYSEFLTPKQIERAYRLEKQMLDRLGKHKTKPQNKTPRK